MALFCVGFGCAYLCWAAFQAPLEHALFQRLPRIAALLRDAGLPADPALKQHARLALFVLYQSLVCAVVTRLLWFALRPFDEIFSVSLLLAMFISGSIFSSAAIVHYGLGAHF